MLTNKIQSDQGWLKGGYSKNPPLELKILENPPLEKFWNTPPPLKSGAKRRLRTGFNHD